ncbi:unnamed protein product [Ambrosiozyma monospora]|uniref:Unnamed protein product n=1 Tax=Ambrosiozyma monospora TaxID=43982 RepID=A0ACB5U4V8_AMBMO|nr:unnamed protein product [Ambrosiozyma monospora]
MLVHLIVYKSKFPGYKYLVAGIITLGVLIFTLGSPKKKSESGNDLNEGNVFLGLFYLTVSLFMDGLTNSTQDQLFKNNAKKNITFTGGHLMACLNLLNFTLTTIYALIFTNQFQYTWSFLQANGAQVIYDVLVFGLLGSLGQIFIFLTLERFNSVVLVTVTVTRKMISMCLSVFLFGHKLTGSQCSGLICVFFGIFLESFYKIFKKKHDKRQVQHDKEIKNEKKQI